MDLAALAENLGLEEDEFAELMDLFVETGRVQISELRDAENAGDAEEIRRIAHSLKGASGNLGFMEISQLSKKIEEQIKSENHENIRDTIEKMNRLIDALSSKQQ